MSADDRSPVMIPVVYAATLWSVEKGEAADDEEAWAPEREEAAVDEALAPERQLLLWSVNLPSSRRFCNAFVTNELKRCLTKSLFTSINRRTSE